MNRKPMPTLNQLKGALSVLENRSKQPASTVIAQVHALVRDAIDVLQEPDPLKQRIGFVLLAIQQSTTVKSYQRGSKTVRITRIVEPELYHWAMAEVHAIAGNAK